MVKRLYNPKTFDYWKKVIAPHFPPLRYVFVCRYVCVHAPVDVLVLVGVVGVVGGFMCRPVIWWHLQALPMQQCGWHCGSLRRIVSFSFFSRKNVISSPAASLHMGSLHPAVVFIITAVLLFLFFLFFLFFWLYLTALNCCSPDCFIIFIFWSVSVGWSDVNRSRRCEVTTVTRHLHLFLLCLLENKRGGGVFFVLFLFCFFQKKKGIKIKCSKMS